MELWPLSIVSIAISLAIALAIISIPVRLQAVNRSLRALAYRGATDGMQPYWDLLAQHPELHAVLCRGNDLDTLSEANRARAEIAWSIRMDSYQAIAVQGGAYMMFSQTMKDNWSAHLREDLRVPAFQVMWERLGRRYHPGMRSWVELELAAIRAGQ